MSEVKENRSIDRSEKILTVARYYLSEHHLLGVMWLPVNAALGPLEESAIAGGAGHVFVTSRASVRLSPVTVKADDVTAFSADPVNIEERRVAHVTHLTHAVHRSLPCDITCKTSQM